MADRTPHETPKDESHDLEMDKAYSEDAELAKRQEGGQRSMTLEELKKTKEERARDED